MQHLTSVKEAKEWTFFSRGNANALYKYSGSDSNFAGKLLRVRLRSTTPISTESNHDFIDTWKHIVYPFLLPHELVSVSKVFLGCLNASQNLDLSERFAFLMNDVVEDLPKKHLISKFCAIHFDSRTGKKKVIFEIKPKWLYDVQTLYCRNCLLKRSKSLTRHFCCIDFLYNRRVSRGLSDLLSSIPTDMLEQLEKLQALPITEILLKYLHLEHSIFKILKRLQNSLDENKSISDIRLEIEVLEKLLALMALRDIGIFLTIERMDAPPHEMNDATIIIDLGAKGSYLIRTIFYDFDLKSKKKLSYWKKTEQELETYYNAELLNWPICQTLPEDKV